MGAGGVKVNWNRHSEHFIFVNFCYFYWFKLKNHVVCVFFPPKLDCCSIRMLIPALTGKQWVWPWKAADTVLSGGYGFCFFFLFGHERLFFFFFAFSSRQKVPISKLPAHFYYIGDPISIDLYLSSGKLVLSCSVYIKEVDKLFFNQVIWCKSGHLDRR